MSLFPARIQTSTKTIRLPVPLVLVLALSAIILAACSSREHTPGETTNSDATARPTLYIAGIPDQDIAVLEKRFGLLAGYLSDETGLDVRYVPSIDYSAVVSAFRQGDIHMAWYGGLTGVQARLAATGAMAIAQRPEDQEFLSVFVARPGSGIETLIDLQGKTFTFGSESSTSGNLMPRFFLGQAGIVPEDDFAAVTYSGSHDKTWKLGESGSVEAGALSAVVWRNRVEGGSVDTARVEVFYTTEPYYDYHWVIRGDLDRRFGTGTATKIQEALLKLGPSSNGSSEILDAFNTTAFIETSNENYEAIEDVARQLGIIQN
jgi:phosphonate transport system substrate-binding protein